MQNELTQSQAHALDTLENDDCNVFLTGYAGTGKSFLVSRFLQGKDQRNIFPVLGSTGVSAMLVGGRTFHSFFGLGYAQGSLQDTVKQAMENRNVKSRLRKARAIIIDEISMISGHLLIAAEMVAKAARDSSEVWGGLRVIVVGDFAQLPPVERGNQKPWAFLSPIWQESRFKPLVLKENVRSEEEEFIEILNKVRHGIVDEVVENFLNEKKQAALTATTTRLFPLREQVSQFNIQKLSDMSGEMIQIRTTYTGQEPYVSSVKKSAPVDEVLYLKKGAPVMIRVNDPMLRYVNGSVGTVVDCSSQDVLLIRINGRIYEFEKISFGWMDGQGEVKAKAINFPVQLSWATTIHKSQGMTLDNAWIDLTRFWEAGQAYVALSRVRNSKHLVIQDWNPKSIKADPYVKQFYESGCPYSFVDHMNENFESSSF